MIVFVGVKKVEENLKRVCIINGLVKDLLKELIIKLIFVLEKWILFFLKFVKVCNVLYYCCFVGCVVKVYVRLKYFDLYLFVF